MPERKGQSMLGAFPCYPCISMVYIIYIFFHNWGSCVVHYTTLYVNILYYDDLMTLGMVIVSNNGGRASNQNQFPSSRSWNGWFGPLILNEQTLDENCRKPVYRWKLIGPWPSCDKESVRIEFKLCYVYHSSPQLGIDEWMSNKYSIFIYDHIWWYDTRRCTFVPNFREPHVRTAMRERSKSMRGIFQAGTGPSNNCEVVLKCGLSQNDRF